MLAEFSRSRSASNQVRTLRPTHMLKHKDSALSTPMNVVMARGTSRWRALAPGADSQINVNGVRDVDTSKF
jgi:hypothetical protein